MKILLFGANGQVGWELQRSLNPLGEVICYTRKDLNLEDFDSLRRIIRLQNPEVIVNAAAYTAVDKAEIEQKLAYRINSEAVEVMVQEAKNLDALLIHYSTDYVFDGRKTIALKETDDTNPLNVYGKSKLQGEQVIQKSNCQHLIFRTSWVYAARGHNFIKTILRLAQEKDELKIVADQTGAPTSAELIADVTALVLHKIVQSNHKNEIHTGLYHLTASGETTWHSFAKTIVSAAQEQGIQTKTKEKKIYPIPTTDYVLPAQRPSYSLLDTTKLCKIFNLRLPFWETDVKRVVSELLSRGAT